MKKIIILYSLLLCIFSCKDKNEYFTSNKFYETVINGVDKIHNEIYRTDSIFYVLVRYDTLIIMSSKNENTLRPTYSIEKIGYFNYKKNKIIITKPYKTKFDLINKNNKLIPINNNLKPPYYHGDDYQKGVVYKIKSLNNFDVIDKGKLTKYFKPMVGYGYPPPPEPMDLK